MSSLAPTTSEPAIAVTYEVPPRPLERRSPQVTRGEFVTWRVMTQPGARAIRPRRPLATRDPREHVHGACHSPSTGKSYSRCRWSSEVVNAARLRYQGVGRSEHVEDCRQLIRVSRCPCSAELISASRRLRTLRLNSLTADYAAALGRSSSDPCMAERIAGRIPSSIASSLGDVEPTWSTDDAAAARSAIGGRRLSKSMRSPR